MQGLTIVWEYLTGYTVSTDPSSRERCEWPPHPARVFMAMAAAWFETMPDEGAPDDCKLAHDAEGEALRWLETLGEPELWLPNAGTIAERSPVTVYVPVNDKAGPAAATLQSAPALTRSKQARTFPCRYIGAVPCALHWNKADAVDKYGDALTRICEKVTRIGHSSSLVRMWLHEALEDDALNELERWQPDDELSSVHCRRISAGLLDSLPSRTRVSEIEQFAEHYWHVEDAARAAATAKETGDAVSKKAANQNLKKAKQDFEQSTGQLYKKAASPPPRLRPKIGLWTGYHRAQTHEPETVHSCFDTDLLVLTHSDGPPLPVTSTLVIGKALRDMIMKRSRIQPVPEWVSGHKPDGSPGDNAEGHMAVLPLPFVGHENADGHLLGMALAFPRGVDRSERGQVLGPLLVNEHGEAAGVRLKLGRSGIWVLHKRSWDEQRYALRSETWTALPRGSDTWASVTPVVLDKFPKADRRDSNNRLVWEQEVRAMIAKACTRIGLPTPIHIDLDTTSWNIGSPRAFVKERRLRDGLVKQGDGLVRFGDGFPRYPAKGSSVSKPQIHVFLQFADPVSGPVLLGAGRFRGYGLFKPLGLSR